jgi:hypothetical protein
MVGGVEAGSVVTSRLTPPDVVTRIAATGIALCGVGIAVVGVALFWGPLRQVLVAPVIVVVGVMAYIAGRGLWGTVDQGVRARH